DADSVVIVTADGAVRIRELTDASGKTVAPGTILAVGESIVPLSHDERRAIEEFTEKSARHEAWFVKRLQTGTAPELYGALPSSDAAAPSLQSYPLPGLAGWSVERAVAAIAGYFARTGTKTPLRLGLAGNQSGSDHNALAGYVGRTLPLVLDVPADSTGENLSDTVAAELAALDVRRGYPSDLALRTPGLSTEPFTVAIVAGSDPTDGISAP